MTTEEIMKVQERIGAVVDGFWGPQSMAACQRWLRGMMPVRNPWPGTSQEELTKFYGKPGDEGAMVRMAVPKGVVVRYFGKELGRPGPDDDTIYCHEKVAESLGRVFKRLARTHPEVLLKYAGMYANRPMRNGSLPSLHARGAAIDLDPDPNGNLTPWPVVATMPLGVMEAFAYEGITSAGAFWHRDAMHHQWTRP